MIAFVSNLVRFASMGALAGALAGLAAAQSPTIGNCPVFPADNIWNTRIDQLPVSPNSGTWVNTIGTSTHLHPDFGSGLYDGEPIGIPYVTVPGTQTKYPATFTYQSESDPGPYAIPLNAPIEGGSSSTGDRHVISVDINNCILYEIFDAFPQTASWQGGSGAIFNLLSDALRPASWTSADAAGLPIFPGLVKYAEIVAGQINHAIRFTAPQTQDMYVWPARHEASSLTSTIYPPMGARFRLKASFDISGFSATNQIILTALKLYGMMLADNGSSWYISGAPDPGWNNDDLHVLNTIDGSNFEAVDVSPLMVNPNSGQALQSSVSVSVTPRTANLQVNGQQQFNATITGNSDQAVTWDVNGVVGGNSTIGFIDSTTGLYTAPAVVPSAATVTVDATSQAVTSAVGSASVTITAAIPSPASVTPNTGSGSSGTFAFAFSDPNGATDISSTQMDIGATLSATGACYFYYSRASNALYLATDAGAWQGPVTVGSAGTLQNSQCSVNAGTSSVMLSVNTLTLNLALTFESGFAGAKNIYMEVRNATQDSGWSALGTFTVTNAGPSPDFSLGMTAGPGSIAAGGSAQYAVTVTALNGFDGTVSFGVSGLPSGVTGSFNPTTVTGSGSTTLTITTTRGAALGGFTITVTGTSGALNHQATASLTITGTSSGGPPAPASVTPNTGSGSSQTFVFAFTDPNGATDISSTQMDFGAALSATGACYFYYSRASNAIYLATDAGAWQGPLTIGSAGTLSNSQCSVNAGTSSVSASGNTLTLSLALTFTAGFAGAKNIYMEVRNATEDSGWSQQGSWTVASGGESASPPAPVSVTPNTGSGSSQTFAFEFSDGNGAADIASAQLDISAQLSATNTCYFYYSRASNALYLANNAGAWQGPLTIGSAGTLGNNQCSVNAGTSSVSMSGNTLTLNLALTFEAAFAGAKNIYMEVQNATMDSGWSLHGGWTVP
jgi:hypothetical protein